MQKRLLCRIMPQNKSRCQSFFFSFFSFYDNLLTIYLVSTCNKTSRNLPISVSSTLYVWIQYIFYICIFYNVYLTIRLRARNVYETIVNEGEARANYRVIEIDLRASNLIVLVKTKLCSLFLQNYFKKRGIFQTDNRYELFCNLIGSFTSRLSAHIWRVKLNKNKMAVRVCLLYNRRNWLFFKAQQQKYVN